VRRSVRCPGCRCWTWHPEICGWTPREKLEQRVRGGIALAGEVVLTLHRGPYAGLRAAHTAIYDWCRLNSRRIGGFSGEIYGDWTDDPNALEMTVVYLLEP
jgi:hypothetical protein